jgi:hypothetical protein
VEKRLIDRGILSSTVVSKKAKQIAESARH